jgi:hypothetical protein
MDDRQRRDLEKAIGKIEDVRTSLEEQQELDQENPATQEAVKDLEGITDDLEELDEP